MVVARFCDRVSLNAAVQRVRELVADNPGLLSAVELAPGRMPCVAWLPRVFTALNIGACERAVG